jgi:hypothetical protein
MKKIAFYLSTLALLILAACGIDGTSSNEIGTIGDTGRGGSLARFATVGNHLFVLNRDTVKVYNTSNPSNPTFVTSFFGGTDLETMFPRDANTLFLGAMSGMFIFDISNPSNPIRLGTYNHITACDPVVADNQYAYLTLRSVQGNWRCWRNVNQMEVIDISDLNNPVEVARVPMSGPMGLAIDNDFVYVCDNGLKVYPKYPNTMTLKHFDASIDAIDLIVGPKSLLVLGKSGVSQYLYDGDRKFTLLSKL